jgi:serine/threonine protein kinase
MQLSMMHLRHELFRRLKSPCLQTLYCQGTHEGPEGPFTFLIFEFVEGEQLAKWCQGRTSREKLKVLVAVSETLDLLAQQGAAHGDLWSENVLVQRALCLAPRGGQPRPRLEPRIAPALGFVGGASEGQELLRELRNAR